jgi:uncharacterized membrane protein
LYFFGPVFFFWLLDVASTYIGLQSAAFSEVGIMASKLLGKIGFMPYILLYLLILWILFFGIVTVARTVKTKYGFYLLYLPITGVLAIATINNLVLLFCVN